MKACLVGLVTVGMVLVSSVSFAQDDFSGRWRPSDTTLISDAWASPFASAAPPVLITQTSDAISWQAADGRPLAIKLNEPFVIAGRTYTARWVDRVLLLEASWALPEGRKMTMVQALVLKANDELEIVSFVPRSLGKEGTEIIRLVLHRSK